MKSLVTKYNQYRFNLCRFYQLLDSQLAASPQPIANQLLSERKRKGQERDKTEES